VFDLVSTAWHPLPPEPGAVIVAIDEPSFAEMGAQWPWSRAEHARLIHALREAGAAAVGLDIVFAEPSADPAADAALADAAAPGVVFAADEALIDTPQGFGRMVIEPMPELLAGGAAAGLVTVPLDGDGVIRRLPGGGDTFARTVLVAAGRPAGDPDRGALLQSFGPARTYPTVSYYQARDPDSFLPDGFFAGRVVLVGFSLQTAPEIATGGADAVATPETAATARLVPGVELQATILDNLRHGLWIRPLPAWVAALGVIAAALAGALAVRGRHPALAAVILAVLAAAVVVASAVLLRHGRVWWPPLAPAAALVVAGGLGSAAAFAREMRARRVIERAFSRYLAPEMVDRLARDPAALRLGGERRTLSVLFADVRGFTTLSETMRDEPERLTALLVRLLDPLSEAVLAHGGTIDKYIGDCVMAFWNAPLADADHARHAVAAALAMAAAVERLNGELATEGLPPFAIGVGINTGECVVGNMGSRRRFDYTAIGDTVNLAARLEGLSKVYGATVVVSEATAAAATGAAEFTPLGRIAVRGRSEETVVFAATLRDSGRGGSARDGGAPGSPATHLPTSPPVDEPSTFSR
jgi:adenylate cyclase